MITPPLLIFYLSVVVLLMGISRLLFKRDYGEEIIGISIGAGLYIFAYLIIYMMINFGG